MVLPLVPAAAGIAVTVALALGAARSGALTYRAGAVAALFGSVIVVLAGFPFLALLVLFVVASVLATRYGFEEKLKRGVHEGTYGEQGVSNVVAHVVLPTGLVLAAMGAPNILPPRNLAVLYTAALAFGGADTFASEFGVLAGRARSILTFRAVPPGTNGGVSALGQLWAVVGALFLALFAAAFFWLFGWPVRSVGTLIVVATVSGFLGCQVDSLLGATLENRDYLTKGTTNLLGMGSSVAIGLGLLQAVGGSL